MAEDRESVHLLERIDPHAVETRLDAPARLRAVERVVRLDHPAGSGQRWAARAQAAVRAPVAALAVVDAHHHVVHGIVGLTGVAPGDRVPRGASICRLVVARGDALAVEDLRAHPSLVAAAEVRAAGLRAYLGIPITVGGEQIGAICVGDHRPRRWTDDDVSRLGDLAESLSTQLALRLAEEQSRRRGVLLSATLEELQAMRDAAEMGRRRLRPRFAAPARDQARDDAATAEEQDAERLATLATALESAPERGGLRLLAQPIVRCADGALHGVEALLRWTHPDLGAVGPDEFVPVAEDTGAIEPIGRWVLQQACRAASRLQAVGRAPTTVGVNVSPRQLVDPGFAESVADALAVHGVGAGRLVLELTETALLGSDPATAANIAALQELGVGLVLDDFGTGFSSLAMLKDQPIDGIKIDRSFVGGLPADETSAAIVDGVVGMARALGRAVTAEGIETRAQLEHVRRLGCDFAQGWLLGRPAPFAALAATA